MWFRFAPRELFFWVRAGQTLTMRHSGFPGVRERFAPTLTSARAAKAGIQFLAKALGPREFTPT